MDSSSVFYFDRNPALQASFRGSFQQACPSLNLVAAASRDQADQILSRQSFGSYVVGLDDLDTFPTELLFQLRTVYPNAHLITLSSSPISAENIFLDERLHLTASLPRSLSPQSLEAIWPPPVIEADGTFSGQLQLTLHELIQLLCNSFKETTVQVRTATDTGWLFFERGQIVHSKTSNQVGIDAARAIIGWKDGRFREVPSEKATEKTITERWENLLMEAAQIADESGL